MEVELKFQIPANRRDAVEADLRLGSVRRTRLRARYFDTPDGALAAHKMVLQLRLAGKQWVQTAKATGRGPLDRLEHNVDVDGDAGLITAKPDVQRHAGSLVGKLFSEILAQTDEPLIEVYSTDIWRLLRCEREGDTYVELALDTGRIVGPARSSGKPRVLQVCELEFELLEGPVQGLVTMAQRWSQSHGLWLSTVSRAAHGERLLSGTDVVVATQAISAVFHGKSARRPTGPMVQQAVITACLAQVLPTASEIAAGSQDAQQVDQLRVGLRRLRTALRELAPLASGFDPAWQAPLAEAFRALGVRREREAVLEAVAPRLAAVGAPPVVLPDGMSADPSHAETVRDVSFQAVLLGLIGFATQHADKQSREDRRTSQDVEECSKAKKVDSGLGSRRTRRYMRERLGKLHAETFHEGKRFESLTHDQQHRVHTRLERLRDLVEFVAPLFREDKVHHYRRRLEPAQDALCQFNDAFAALQAYREATSSDLHAWFAVGWLDARQVNDASDCAKALSRIEKARSFW